jgi:undecaprenyl diphosphate synthase
VAVIMDGNGRWAQDRGLPRIEGHRRGVATVRRITEECVRLGIKTLTLYCLSSENWKRPAGELKSLMLLLEQYMVEERRLFEEQGIRLRVIGRRDRLSAEALKEMNHSIHLTESNRTLQLVLAIDYGGRHELVMATRRIAQQVQAGRLALDQIDEACLSDHLDTAGFEHPEPDLLIRTGGEMRLSNFLLWQMSYAEIWVTPIYWPDFQEQDFHFALANFAARDRRFGGL